jgi:tRNA(adenine34) deaminase
MRAAIALSQTAMDAGCMPFGAVATDADGNFLVRAHNNSKTAKKRGGTGDVTRHAELELARKELSQDIPSDQRSKVTIYTSTEPCVMCGGAIYWSGVNRVVVYGCSALELEVLSGPGGFDIPIEQLYSMGRAGARKIEIVGPLLSDEAMKVHRESGIWCHDATNATDTTDTKGTTTTTGANDKDIETE